MKIEEYGKIVCAALLKDNCIYMGRGGHHEIFPMENLGVLRCAKQGFVTEKGYFVDRKLGLEIAMYHDQINKKYNPLNKLVSEDLKKNTYKVSQRKEYKYKGKQEGIIMKTYSKEQIIQEIVLILKFYSNEKDNLLYANLLMNKINNEDEITLSKEEIEKYLFNIETKEINEVIFRSLRNLKADMSGVNFENVNIRGLNFNGFLGIEINLDKVPNKDLTKTTFKGVKLTGTLDNSIIDNTNFDGYIGEINLNPQNVVNKSIKGAILSGINITGSLDGIIIDSVDFKGAKGNLKINPQKVPNKELAGVDFSGVEFCDDEGKNNPSFEDCIIYDCKFKGAKGNIVINLDLLKSSLYPKLALCDLTNVTVLGNAKSNYAPVHCVKQDGSVIFDTVGDDLFGAYYFDENDKYVHIYLYESMVWDEEKSTWKYIQRKKEKNLKIKVSYNIIEEKVKQKLLSKFRKK